MGQVKTTVQGNHLGGRKKNYKSNTGCNFLEPWVLYEYHKCCGCKGITSMVMGGKMLEYARERNERGMTGLEYARRESRDRSKWKLSCCDLTLGIRDSFKVHNKWPLDNRWSSITLVHHTWRTTEHPGVHVSWSVCPGHACVCRPRGKHVTGAAKWMGKSSSLGWLDSWNTERENFGCHEW